MPLRGSLLILFIVGSLPVCFIRPFYGIILWTIIAFLNPQAYTWSAAASFPWALAVAVPTILGFLAFDRGLQRIRGREVFLLLLLWGWFFVSTAISTNTPLFMHHAQDTWYRFNFVSKILLMTVLTVAIVSNFERLRTLVIVIACCFGAYVVKSFPFIVMTGGAHRLYGPDHSMIADNNDFGLALNMTLPLFFFLAQTETKKWYRRGFGFLFLLTIPCIFFTYSRGALLGLVVLSTLMLLRLKQRFLLLPVAGLAIAVALLFAPEEWRHRMDPTRSDAVDASARARFNAWNYAWNLASEYPVAGGGFDTFTHELFARYAPNGAIIHGPHSVYFEILAEHGFVGLALYLTLIASCFATTFSLSRAAKRRGDPVVAQYCLMFQFCITGFLISGIFLGRAYFDYYFTIVACIAALKRVITEEWWAEDNAAHDAEHDAIDEVAGEEPEPVRALEGERTAAGWPHRFESIWAWAR